jgi:hypothetical protein
MKKTQKPKETETQRAVRLFRELQAIGRRLGKSNKGKKYIAARVAADPEAYSRAARAAIATRWKGHDRCKGTPCPHVKAPRKTATKAA